MIDRLREATLWTGAVLGLVSVVAGTAVMFFGFTFLIFRSGSMGPEIPTGSLALARTTPASELESGDVVSVIAANGERITHRLVSSTVRGDEASLILQGDANGTPDQEIYQVTEVEREIVSIPLAGYVVTILLSPAGLVAAGCLSGMLFLLGFGARDDDDRRTPSRRGGGRHRDGSSRGRRQLAGASMAMALVGVVVVAVGANATATSATFTDKATATTGTFSMAAIVLNPPRNVTCDGTAVLGLLADFIVWDAPAGSAPIGYTLSWTSNQGADSRDVGTATQARPNPPSGNGNVDYDVSVTARYSTGNSVTVASNRQIRGRTNFTGGFTWTCRV